MTSTSDEEQLRALIYAYCRGVDRLDGAQIRAVFHEDAILDFGAFEGSPAQFSEMVPVLLGKLKSSHHSMCNILLAIDGDVASSETYGIAFHGGHQDGDSLVDFISYVRYIDRFERRGGVWKIARRKVVQDAKQVMPHSTAGSTTLAREIPTGARDRSDPSYGLNPPLGLG